MTGGFPSQRASDAKLFPCIDVIIYLHFVNKTLFEISVQISRDTAGRRELITDYLGSSLVSAEIITLNVLQVSAKLFRTLRIYHLYRQCLPYFVVNTGLDTNGCPLGNSKFILQSDNLNICLWLSACQVEKIIKLAWSVSHNVIGAIDNVSISCGHILAFAGLLSLCTLCYHLILWMKNCPVTCIGHDWDYQRWLLW